MKNIILSTVVAATILNANGNKYEITPMYSYTDSVRDAQFDNYDSIGLTIGIKRGEDCKFDVTEFGFFYGANAEYAGTNIDTKATKIFLNQLKEYDMLPKLKLFALVGLGYEDTDDSITSDPYFNYGAGLKYKFTDSYSLRVDARHIFKPSGVQNVMYSVGFGVSFGEKSAKQPIKDEPKDELKKVEDIPEVVILLDSDNDGINDNDDMCESTPNGIKVDNKGCELDSDNDGIKDSKDICSNTITGVKVDSKGCELDSDNDGIVDSKDNCNNTSENIKVDDSGCPIVVKELLVPADLGIVFETNSADIKSDDESKLDLYVIYLKEVPTATMIIEAHTDSIGSEDYNLQLSQKRANSVKDKIVSMGIDPKRIEAIGYGETKPLVSNDTPLNRAKNRRVTAKIIK